MIGYCLLAGSAESPVVYADGSTGSMVYPARPGTKRRNLRRPAAYRAPRPAEKRTVDCSDASGRPVLRR